MKLPDAIAKRAGNWHFSKLSTVMITQVESVSGGPLQYSDIGIYLGLTLWGQRDGRVTANRTSLAEALGVGRKTLFRHLERLQEAGWVRYEDQPDNVAKARTIVLVNLDDWAALRTGRGSPMTHVPGERGSPMTHDVGHPRPVRGSPMTHISTKKKDEEGNDSNAGAFVSQEAADSILGKNEEVKREDKKKGLREKNSTVFVPPGLGANGTAPPIVKSGHGPEPVPVDPRTEEPTWPPRNAGDIYRAWTYEVTLKHPDFKAAKNGGPKTNKLLLDLTQRYGADVVRDLIRVAVWDWSAIQETMDTWFTKDATIPEPRHLPRLAAALSTKLKTGVTSGRRRESEYRRRYVLKEPPKKTRKPGELNKAQAFRKSQGLPY